METHVNIDHRGRRYLVWSQNGEFLGTIWPDCVDWEVKAPLLAVNPALVGRE